MIRLESDHRSVADLLDRVEQEAYRLDDGPDLVARQALSGALTALSELLLEHLDREESVLGPLLGSAADWFEPFV